MDWTNDLKNKILNAAPSIFCTALVLGSVKQTRRLALYWSQAIVQAEQFCHFRMVPSQIILIKWISALMATPSPIAVN